MTSPKPIIHDNPSTRPRIDVEIAAHWAQVEAEILAAMQAAHGRCDRYGVSQTDLELLAWLRARRGGAR